MRRQAKVREKRCRKSDGGFIAIILKELLKLSNKKPNNSVKWAKDIETHHQKKTENMHMKKEAQAL